MQTLDHFKWIDIHYHANPDLYHRRWDAFEAGQIYQKISGAVILKSHLGSTSIQATLAQKKGLPVLPSLVLNQIAGGIDYRVVLHALNEYQPCIAAKMLVHLPTITGRKINSKLPRTLTHPHLKEYSLAPETIFNHNHRVRKEVLDILRMTKDHPIIVSSGHASQPEVYELINACIQLNVEALLLNQPSNPLTGLNARQLNDISKNAFVWIEQTALTYLLGHQTKEDFDEVLTTLPRVLYSSDLGQISQIDILQWIDFSEQIFKDLRVAPHRQEELLRLNAIHLLSIDCSGEKGT